MCTAGTRISLHSVKMFEVATFVITFHVCPENSLMTNRVYVTIFLITTKKIINRNPIDSLKRSPNNSSQIYSRLPDGIVGTFPACIVQYSSKQTCAKYRNYKFSLRSPFLQAV